MELNSKNVKKILLIITFTVVLFWGLQHFDIVLSLVSRIIGIFAPFLFGLSLAFILNVLLRGMEAGWNRLFRKHPKALASKAKRPICLLACLVSVAAVLFIAMFLIFPQIGKTAETVAKMLPEYFSKLETWWNDLVEYLQNLYISLPALKIDWDKIVSFSTKFLTEGGLSFFNTTMGITTSIFNGLFTFILGFVFSIYVLLQKDKLKLQFQRLMLAFLPEKRVTAITDVLTLANRIFSGFVRGQLTEAIIIGVLCFIGMRIFSMPYAPMISALISVTALIPMFGAFIGVGIGAFLILMVDPMKALWFIIFFIVLQQFEGNLIYPRVVGKSVGLPGIWVLAAVTVSGSMFGFFGMLVSVPTCSVLYCLLRAAVGRRLKRKGIVVPNADPPTDSGRPTVQENKTTKTKP